MIKGDTRSLDYSSHDRTLKLADFGLSIYLRPGEKLDAATLSVSFPLVSCPVATAKNSQARSSCCEEPQY